MRVFSAGIDSETNTFTNLPTTRKSFERCAIWRGSKNRANSWMTPMPQTWERLSLESGFEYVEGTYAAAKPSGLALRNVYERLREDILHDVTTQGSFDVVLLHMGGAMIADGYDDCEGDLLKLMRAALPPAAIIGVVLDPHCHLTEAMVSSANVLVACKYYPHDDFAERAAEVFVLCSQAAQRKVRPVPSVFDCKVIGLYPTHRGPMAEVIQGMLDAERSPDILSVSFIHGFPWGDTADTGSKVLEYADGDFDRASACATSLGRMIYSLRDRLVLHYPSIEEGLDDAAGVGGLVVLADTADNPGGGAAGDNVTVLKALLHRKTRNAALGSIWDPQVAEICAEAGVGAILNLRLGGKINSSSGQALDVTARVCAINTAHYQTSLGDTRQDMGLSVWLDIEGIDVVVSTVRSQVFAPDLFTGLGIELLQKRIVVVKSANHFYSRFAPLARRVIHLATPGALSLDFANIKYLKRAPDYFPRIQDPLHGL